MFFGRVYLWVNVAQGLLSTGRLEAMDLNKRQQKEKKGTISPLFLGQVLHCHRAYFHAVRGLNVSSSFKQPVFDVLIPTSCDRGSGVAGRPANKHMNSSACHFSRSWPFCDHWTDSEHRLVKFATSNHVRRFKFLTQNVKSAINFL